MKEKKIVGLRPLMDYFCLVTSSIIHPPSVTYLPETAPSISFNDYYDIRPGRKQEAGQELYLTINIYNYIALLICTVMRDEIRIV